MFLIFDATWFIMAHLLINSISPLGDLLGVLPGLKNHLYAKLKKPQVQFKILRCHWIGLIKTLNIVPGGSSL